MQHRCCKMLLLCYCHCTHVLFFRIFADFCRYPPFTRRSPATILDMRESEVREEIQSFYLKLQQRTKLFKAVPKLLTVVRTIVV